MARRLQTSAKPRPIMWGLAIGLTLGLLLALGLGDLWIGLIAGALVGLVIGVSLLWNLRRLKGRK